MIRRVSQLLDYESPISISTARHPFFRETDMAKEIVGRWTDVVSPEFNAVMVHASLLPDRTVLYWGRRQNPQAKPPQSLDEHFTQAFVWTPPTWVAPPWNASTQKFDDKKSDPISGQSVATPNQPTPLNWNGNPKEKVSLFCSGHCFLPDGKLLVVGGHIKDGFGVNQACTYDYNTKLWSPQIDPPMRSGRWYPSVLPLPDGRALVISGSEQFYSPFNIPQIFSPNGPKPWTDVIEPVKPATVAANKSTIQILYLFPRVHLDPTGRVFMAGPATDSWFLELKDKDGNDVFTDTVDAKGKPMKALGAWKSADTFRKGLIRDYAPSVMYDSGRVMYIGGGIDNPSTDQDGNVQDIKPTQMVEYIDFTKDGKWKSDPLTNMQIPRRQFNATVLPDGSVLVTGGSTGGGFNDLSNTVKVAELFDPSAPKPAWVKMAAESFNRCYHGIALLLPDGRVLSAGSGEYGGADPTADIPPKDPPNPPQNLTNGQLFEPPYLFKGPRPTISNVSKVEYNGTIEITVGAKDLIAKVSLVRLGSVTHCRNMNQSLMFLKPVTLTGPKIKVLAPASPNLAPPGHYMLFVLSQQGVPSEASIVVLPLGPVTSKQSKPLSREAAPAQHVLVSEQVQPSLFDHDKRIIAEQARPHVVVGMTPICPYGLGPCWAGAYEGLHEVNDIDVVRPVPHHDDCLAFVYLKDDIIPDIDVWRNDFKKVAHATYDMRGIEMTLSGAVTKTQDDQIKLAGTSTRPDVVLAPFQPHSQLKWDMKAEGPRPITDEEAGAYKRLTTTLADHTAGVTMQVTGTLQKHDANEFSLDVREFEIQKNAVS